MIVRYPGGKQRFLTFILSYLPPPDSITGRFIDPFIGGGSIYFMLNPCRAVLSDINSDLIDLYRGIRKAPKKVWSLYQSFPCTKEGYYQIRDMDISGKDLIFRAARTLYLNRTCFKGMWRHNAAGKFNVGYGGQSRRWVINEEILRKFSLILRKAELLSCDFETTLVKAQEGDFIFADPPYKPGERELKHAHYRYGRFQYEDYVRLAACLTESTKRGVKWALTISSHPDILELFKDNRIIFFPRGTGKNPGVLTDDPGEVLVLNYEGGI